MNPFPGRSRSKMSSITRANVRVNMKMAVKLRLPPIPNSNPTATIAKQEAKPSAHHTKNGIRYSTPRTTRLVCRSKTSLRGRNSGCRLGYTSSIRLAAGVAHDLNNVLSGLSSYPELMLMDVGKDDPLRRPLEIVKKSGERAAAIIQDLLMLARSGNAEHKSIDVGTLIADYLKSAPHLSLTRRYPETGVSLDLSKKPLYIRGSEIMIKKTLEYLVPYRTKFSLLRVAHI